MEDKIQATLDVMPEMPIEYRLYTFTASLYLSDKQKGIQSAHVLGEMITMYMIAEPPYARHTSPDGYYVNSRDMLAQWATLDKTIIVKGASTSGEVVRIWTQLAMAGYPFALFKEDQESLGGAATACGAILPYYVWKLADNLREAPIKPSLEAYSAQPEAFEIMFEGKKAAVSDVKLALLMNQYPLA